MATLIASLLLLQAPPAQTETEKLEAQLKKFGNRTYAMYVSGRKAGKLTMKSKLETEDGRRIVVFEDIRLETSAGGTVKVTVTEKASVEGVRLISSRRVTDSDGRKALDLITVTGSKAAVRFDDEKRKELEIPEKTVGEQAVLRLVCSAVQEKGTFIAIDVLSQFTGELESRELKCEGKVDIEIGDRKVEAIRWQERGQAGKPGGHVKNTYWVSSAGHLLKYVGGGGVEYVLESK
ncbi:MAG TPA: hypothetical protein VFS19_06810 [Planctomycetota bacterium]|nr:hypothetical protein [Planctomycetota bacterium]